MVSSSSSAQRARQALADQLREIRKDAGLTGLALADRAGIHRTTVAKIEHGQRSPTAEQVRAWCAACGAEGQVDDLLSSLRTVESAYVEWRRVQRTGFRRLQETMTDLYVQSADIRSYSGTVVPGLLQTPDYCRAVLSRIGEHHGTRDDINSAIEVRMNRRELLRDGTRRFVCVLEESVLHHRIGSADVMREQLDFLLDVMSWPAIAVQVVPFGVDRPQWPIETFMMFDDHTVRVELLSARVQVEAAYELDWYRRSFTTLAGMAVAGQYARRLIEKAR